MGSHLFFRGLLPVRPVLALLCTCANGSTHSVFSLQLPMLLHVVAGTTVLKLQVWHLQEHQKLEQNDTVLVTP